MTPEDRRMVKEIIEETVSEVVGPVVEKAVVQGIPIAVAEVLTPMIAHTVKKTIRRQIWITRAGYLVLAIACLIMFIQIGKQARHNTEANAKQDCYLSGLLRASIVDTESRITRKQRVRAVKIVNDLEDGKRCGHPPLSAKLPSRRANP